jgi:hypothetical protein
VNFSASIAWRVMRAHPTWVEDSGERRVQNRIPRGRSNCDNTKGYDTSSPLKAFKRAVSLELSKWYMGTLMTNLAETKDTNGAFLLVEGILVPRTEPASACPFA